MKTAADIMTQNPIALNASMLISEAVKKMMTLHISSAPVIDPSGKLMGQLSEVHLLKAYILTSRPENAYKTINDFPNLLTKVTTVKIDETIDKVVRQMIESENHRVLVLDKSSHLKGIISPKDILRFLVGDKNEQGTMMDEFRILKDRLGILKDQLSFTKDQLKQFSSVVEKSEFMVHSADASGKILLANEKMHMVLGYSTKELIGKTIYDLYDPSYHEPAKKGLGELAAGKDSLKLYATYLTKLGNPIRVEVFSTPIKAPDGSFLSTSSFSRLVDSEDLLRALHGVYDNKS